jgi:acetoin utilization deacetylase AcuC-like enzyme
MSKYRVLRERVLAELQDLRLAEADAASPGELALAHDPDYIDRVFEGRLDAQEQRVIGLLKNDAQLRTAFLDKVAGPISNKMFECGMIP